MESSRRKMELGKTAERRREREKELQKAVKEKEKRKRHEVFMYTYACPWQNTLIKFAWLVSVYFESAGTVGRFTRKKKKKKRLLGSLAGL